MIGDGSGHFTDQTASLFAGGIPYVHYVPRIFAADFNKDGVTDIFTPDFGIDGPPFPGGQNSLFLSGGTNAQIVNATATLPQGLRQNHGTSLGDVNKDGYLDIFVNHSMTMLATPTTCWSMTAPAISHRRHRCCRPP